VLYTTDYAFWYSNEGHHNRTETFTQGHTARLIISVLPEAGAFVPYNGEYVVIGRLGLRQHKIFRLEQQECLEGDRLTVRVALIGTRGGRRMLRQNFDYELITTKEEQSFKFIEAVNYLRSDEYP
jgi:hypothetical protein